MKSLTIIVLCMAIGSTLALLLLSNDSDTYTTYTLHSCMAVYAVMGGLLAVCQRIYVGMTS